MATTKYSGKDLVIAFKGTVIEASGQSFEVPEETPSLEATCFGESDDTYVSSAITNHKASYKGLDATLEGSAFDVVKQGATGTLAWYPQGSSSGKPSMVAASAHVTMRNRAFPVKGLVTLNADFQISGAVTESTV